MVIISIHAPRVGSDTTQGVSDSQRAMISIHAPRVGSDQPRPQSSLPGLIFQSTLPVWGATLPQRRQNRSGPISIHAPRVGSDD